MRAGATVPGEQKKLEVPVCPPWQTAAVPGEQGHTLSGAEAGSRAAPTQGQVPSLHPHPSPATAGMQLVEVRGPLVPTPGLEQCQRASCLPQTCNPLWPGSPGPLSSCCEG